MSRPRNPRLTLDEAAAEFGVTPETVLDWEQQERIPRIKRYRNPYGGWPRPMLSRERVEHIKTLRRFHGPTLRNYRVGFGHLPVGK